MSDLDLSGLREIAKAAHDHIGNLCTGEDRWRMTVPPRDDDSDMLFSTLADGVLALLDRIEEQDKQLAEFRARESEARADAWDEGMNAGQEAVITKSYTPDNPYREGDTK